MTIDNGGVSAMQAMAEVKAAKQVFGAQVVKATLDVMNSGSMGGAGKNADYDFQTKVLEAGMMSKGVGVNSKV